MIPPPKKKKKLTPLIRLLHYFALMQVFRNNIWQCLVIPTGTISVAYCHYHAVYYVKTNVESDTKLCARLFASSYALVRQHEFSVRDVTLSFTNLRHYGLSTSASSVCDTLLCPLPTSGIMACLRHEFSVRYVTLSFTNLRHYGLFTPASSVCDT